jgi:ferric iron reductase protein FhuF
VPPPVDAAPALRRASGLGPFFAIDVIPESVAWQRFSAFLSSDQTVLLEQVAATRSALTERVGSSQVEERVAASLWFLGWSARLVSPWLGAAALAGVVPVVEPDALLWRPASGQPLPLAVHGATGQAIETLYDACIGALVEPLLEATAQAYPISRQVLWGNVASAVAGAGGQLARGAPSYAAVGRALAEGLLTTGALRGQGGFSGGQFARRTCCLMYRLPGAGLCADCVLVRP